MTKPAPKPRMDDLEQRVNQFNTMSLPGQPVMMHMGTSHLIHDLWERIQELEDLIIGMNENLDIAIGDQ